MAKTKLTVKTELGTFTRTTDRTYTHIVVVQGYRAELIEAQRLAEIADDRKTAAKYRQVVAAGFDASDRGTRWFAEHTAKRIADGSYAKWIAELDANAAKLEALPPVTQDGQSYKDYSGGPVEPHVLGWCGRLDLARKLAAGKEASRYRTVKIVDVVTGAEVRW